MALQEYKCPNCSGAIAFDVATQEMVCPYCGTTMNVEALKALDDALANEQKSEAIDWGYQGYGWYENEQQGLSVYSCNSCGGEIVGDETLGATSCPFCGNVVVVSSKFSGTFRPEAVIPFRLDKNEALKALEKHYLKKVLLPKVFKDKNHLDEIKGVYVPFWLYKADVDANINYRATTVRSWSNGSYDYTETSYFHVNRNGDIGFDDVPVDGSKSIADDLMESIEPYPMEAAVAFQTAYLAGFFANKYDVTAEENTPRAYERMKVSAADAFRQTVQGYSTVETKSSNLFVKNGSVRYMLLPVWLLNTSWEGKNFIFAMNGYTGKFVGNLPLDKKAFWKWFSIIFGIFAAACIIITMIGTSGL